MYDHVIERARYLSSIPAPVLYDVVMACLPREPLDQLGCNTTDCVVRTLEHEYGEKLIHALSQSKLVSSSEIHKMQRCENKLSAVAARQQDQLDLLMTKFKNAVRFFWHADCSENFIQARVL